LIPPDREDTPREDPTSLVGPTFNCISRVLSKHNIRIVGLLHRKVTNFLHPIKYDLGLKTPCIYSIHSVQVWVYVGQIGCSVETMVRKHHWHIWLYHLEKSAMTEHIINLGHHIQCHDFSILAKQSGHMECLIREVTEIKPHHDNMNRAEGFSMSRSWKPLIQILKE
jgi:hypothetical protein